MNKVRLNRENFGALRKFLYECGFTQKQAEQCLNQLSENTSGGDINLVDFFHKLNERSGGKTDERSTVWPEMAAVPHIESVLRNLGLTPNELAVVFNASKSQEGRLDLKRMTAKLKEIDNRTKPSDQKIVDQEMYRRDVEKLRGMGLDLPEAVREGRLNLKNFITALEAMIASATRENQKSSEINAVIGQIAENAVISDHKTPASPADKNKTIAKGDPITPFKTKGGRESNQNLKSASKTEVKPADNKSGFSSNKNNHVVSDFEVLREEALVHPDKAGALEEFAKTKTETNARGHVFKPETATASMLQHMNEFNFAETIHSAQQSNRGLQNFLPTYLVDQVGKQISKALLKGDRIVRLQLKPPELGIMKVEIDMKDGALKLGVHTENSAVKELVLSNVHELKEALLQQNVKLAKLDVQISYHFDQSLANSPQWQTKDQGGGRESNKDWLSAANNTAVQPSNPHEREMSRQLLDLIV